MKAVDFALDLIFPKICQKCGVEGNYLCSQCLSEIKPPTMFCPECDKPSTLGLVHPVCKKQNTPLDALMVAAEYNEQAVRNLVWQLKYNSAKTVSEDLSVLLADFLVTQNILDHFADFTLASVPLHKTRLKLRGFNQAETISKNLSRKLGLRYLELLTKLKKTKRQVDLTLEQRVENVKNVFQIINRADTPKKILLIDDIATTGSTLLECAKVLKKAGAKEVWGLVLARNK